MLQQKRPIGGRPAQSRLTLELCGRNLTIEQVHCIARGGCRLRVTDNPDVLARMGLAEEIVRQAIDAGDRIYGVTTGFGSMAAVPISADLAATSQANLLSFLAAGAGRPVDSRHVRGAMVLRANMLLRGVSGVRLPIVERFVTFLNEDAIPIVGELGSIGASGDLVPLATIARVVLGHSSPSRVTLGEKQVDGATALATLGLEPIKLLPKEALAIVNGTSFSAAIAANCVHATRNFLAISLATNVMMFQALLGHAEPFASFVHECKPHPGQLWSAKVLRELLAPENASNGDGAIDRTHLQDVYSLRCLPQYVGPIAEGIARVARVVEIEMNSVTDNPLIDVEHGTFCQSGNFLGQYVGLAMDDLRRFLGLLAKHLDVQIARLVAPEFNHGLPASLKGNNELSFNMGLKGLQITGNSIMPMLTYFGNPIVEHFPTHAEQFNQNVNGLSWGSANLAWRSVELFTQYSAIALIFAAQAVDLRAQTVFGHYDGRAMLGPGVVPLYESVYTTLERDLGEASPLIFNDADQSLEQYIQLLSKGIDSQGAIVNAVTPLVDSFNNSELCGSNLGG